MIIGVTGTIGAGKSSFAAALVRALEERGLRAMLVDADKVAREVVEETTGETGVLAELAARFGADVVRPDGTLDRALMASRAFANDATAEALNAIIHPQVIERTRRIIHGAADSGGAKAAPATDHFVLDVPLLFESGMDRLCDHVVAVTASPEIRRKRAAKFVDREIRERRQWSQERKAAAAGTVVANDGSLDDLARKAVEISRKLVT